MCASTLLCCVVVSLLSSRLRLQHLNKYKLVYSHTTSGAQSLTAMSCVNSFLSGLILLADSTRGLHWLDACSGRLVRSVNGAHSKSIHCITMNPSSAFACSPGAGAGAGILADDGETNIDAQQLFATAAMDSTIKLWDVRTKE
jgi:WD40 repeat protein